MKMKTQKKIKGRKNTGRKNTKKNTKKVKGGGFWDFLFKTKSINEKKEECLQTCNTTYNNAIKAEEDAKQQPVNKEPVNKEPVNEVPPQGLKPQQPQGPIGGKRHKKRTNKYKNYSF